MHRRLIVGLLALTLLPAGGTHSQTEHAAGLVGPAWYAWERGYDVDASRFTDKWGRVGREFGSKGECVAWAVHVMIRDDSEQFICSQMRPAPGT